MTRRLDVLQATIGELREELERARADLVAENAGAAQRIEARLDGVDESLDRSWQMLRHIDEGGTANRRRLYALRESEEYGLAFAEPDPLVSFVVPTYKRFDTLRDVALPSILAQTHTNIEVIVVGDCAPAETAEVVAGFGDKRIRYYNRTVRGPYPDDPSIRWYMIGSPPFNDGVSLARGRWIAALGDDDAVRPDHTEILLRAARENRHEHCYGRHKVHYPSGETLEIGSFPPQRGEYVLQAALYHSGLRFFQMESADSTYEEPNDWSLCRRMLEAGVRFGMVEQFLADKHESRYQSHAEWHDKGVPGVE